MPRYKILVLVCVPLVLAAPTAGQDIVNKLDGNEVLDCYSNAYRRVYNSDIYAPNGESRPSDPDDRWEVDAGRGTAEADAPTAEALIARHFDAEGSSLHVDGNPSAWASAVAKSTAFGLEALATSAAKCTLEHEINAEYNLNVSFNASSFAGAAGVFSANCQGVPNGGDAWVIGNHVHSVSASVLLGAPANHMSGADSRFSTSYIRVVDGMLDTDAYDAWPIIRAIRSGSPEPMNEGLHASKMVSGMHLTFRINFGQNFDGSDSYIEIGGQNCCYLWCDGNYALQAGPGGFESQGTVFLWSGEMSMAASVTSATQVVNNLGEPSNRPGNYRAIARSRAATGWSFDLEGCPVGSKQEGLDNLTAGQNYTELSLSTGPAAVAPPARSDYPYPADTVPAPVKYDFVIDVGNGAGG